MSPLRTLTSAAALAAATVAVAAPAASADIPLVAYAQLTGDEPAGLTGLPPAKAFDTGVGGTLLDHSGPGRYRLSVDGIGLLGAGLVPGSVMVRKTGPSPGSCRLADRPRAGSTILHLDVACFGEEGTPIDRGFTISYTRNGSDGGDLVTARSPIDPEPVGAEIIARQEQVSLGGVRDTIHRVTVTRTGVGTYTWRLPFLAGDRPADIQLSPGLYASSPGPGAAGAVCGIDGTKVLDHAAAGPGKYLAVRVTCRGHGATGRIDVPMDIAYARGVNILGESPFNWAIVSAPKTTAAVTPLGPGRVQNTVRGVDGGGTLVRSRAGHYEVVLPNQQDHVPPATHSVTAEGSTADCRVTSTGPDAGATALDVSVLCTRPSDGRAIDTAFHLQYVSQPTGAD